MRIPSLCVVAFLTLVLGGSLVVAQTNRALLVGINNYAPANASDNTRGSTWVNLDGCLNDVRAVHSVLLQRYGFRPELIDTLMDRQASRAAILNKLKELGEKSQKGDVVVFFYSGHGSWVKNSLSQEKDKKDEAIVPFDAYLGTPYIRDKELTPLLNAICDKGALLTVILDCCHSGSMTRGLPLSDPPKYRYLPMDSIDMKDPSDTPMKPFEKGALVFSAVISR